MRNRETGGIVGGHTRMARQRNRTKQEIMRPTHDKLDPAAQHLLGRVTELAGEAFPGSHVSQQPASAFFSPARVNLIGDHIDYTGGMVFPAAIQFGTMLVARPNGLSRLRAASLNRPERVDLPLDAPLRCDEPVGWGDYVKGVFAEYAALGVDLPGIDLAVGGNIPGNGLSSSASLEVGVALVIEAMTGFRHSDDEFRNLQAISWLAQRAENRFVGLNCGIMDQAAVALGRESHAMLMDCNNLDITYVPVELGDYELVILNSRKDRRLGESKYNERRSECDAALEILAPRFGIAELCELKLAQLPEALASLQDPILQKRVRHAVSEHDRVLGAAQCLDRGDLDGFGQALRDSHRSLAEDYDVSGKELDSLVAAALRQPGVKAARMTGAGFGGCAVALIERNALDTAAAALSREYEQTIGYPPSVHPVVIGAGARRLTVVT